MSESKKSGKMGAGCLTLFGAVFFLAGLGISAFGFVDLFQYFQAKSYVPVYATIHETDLEVSYSDDSTTYKVTAQYSFPYEGKVYHSDRVHFAGGYDNIGSFHHDQHRRLERAMRSGETIKAWVNPDNPTESWLTREMRWGLFGFNMIFLVVFGGVGLAIMIGGRIAGRNAAKRQNFQQENPERAWQAREEWQSATLQSNNKTTMWVAVGFATLWNLISAPIPFVAYDELIVKQNWLFLVAFLFPAVGLGLAAWAVAEVRRYRRFGKANFTMDPFPAHPGGLVRGTLSWPRPFPATCNMDVQLRLLRKVTTGSGKNRKTREHTLWEEKVNVRVSQGQRATKISFAIPKSARCSDDSNSSDQVIWRLSAMAAIDGPDFKADFEVPVIPGEADPMIQLAAESMRSESKSEDDNRLLWKDTGVQYSRDHGIAQFHFPRGFRLNMGLIILVFALVFGGTGVGLVVLADVWIIGIIFAAFGLLMLVIALHSILYTCTLRCHFNKLEYHSAWLFATQQDFSTRDIADFHIKQSSSAGNTQYYSIELLVKPGTHRKTKWRIVQDIEGRRATESLVRKIREELRL